MTSARRRIVEDGRTIGLRRFMMDMWKARAAELGHPAPADLSSSCKFGALLVQGVLGGEIRGNHDHVHCRLPDGSIVDLSLGSADVLEIAAAGRDPHLHQRAFVRSRAFRESLDSCRPRVERWMAEWHARNPRKTA